MEGQETRKFQSPLANPMFSEEQRNQVSLPKAKQESGHGSASPGLALQSPGHRIEGSRAERLGWRVGSLPARPLGENSKQSRINSPWDIPQDQTLQEDPSWDATLSVLPRQLS